MSSNFTSTNSHSSAQIAVISYDDHDHDNGGGGGGGGHYIEHQVSHFDTLAGVAIKYGVEVADIKRMNGLATDLQMYALKSLQIPSLRRHPPAPSISNGSPSAEDAGTRWTQHRRRHSFETFQIGNTKSSKPTVSQAMSTLQNYYGLKSPSQNGVPKETEMTSYGTGNCNSDPCPFFNSPFNNRLQKSENGVMMKDVPITDIKDGEKYVRRRQKADLDCTPEKLLKEENGSGGKRSSFTTISGKGLAPRPKSSTRLAADAEAWLLKESVANDGLGGVHKSLSTSSLQDQENGSSASSASAWLSSKWNLKPDLQVLSAASIARPIFDGLPKPGSGRKNKAALD